MAETIAPEAVRDPSELERAKGGAAVELQTLEADTVLAGPNVRSQQVPLGAGQLSVQVPRDEALGLVTGQRVQPLEDSLPMPHQQEAHA